MLRPLLVKASQSEALARQITARTFTRRTAMRFVAGEELEDGLRAARRLADEGKLVSLDYVGEHADTQAAARDASKVYLEMVDRVGAEGLPAGLSLKPTQLGLSVSRDLCEKLIDEIATAAAEIDAHITLDMEDSHVTEGTVRLVELLQERGQRHVGCAVQSYLHRTRADVRRLSAVGASLRLCKGAYSEPPYVAYTSKRDVDASWADCAKYLIQHGTYPRLATHDHRLVAKAKADLPRLGRDRDDVEFQMLYGVRADMQDALVRDGYRLCVYVPFGSNWFAYFMRRIAERPANVVFFLRALGNK
ncbi:MAG: proline dehydrogenase family protein [Actinomycetota bacterium]|nr:proline dehydrogenase family protein [Actinomycetota bacterium]